MFDGKHNKREYQQEAWSHESVTKNSKNKIQHQQKRIHSTMGLSTTTTVVEEGKREKITHTKAGEAKEEERQGSELSDRAPTGNREDDNDPSEQRKRAVAAGVMTGVLGFIIGGPIVATAVGLGVGYLAAHETLYPLHTSATKVGDFALNVQSRGRQVENKHHYVEKTNTFLTSLWNRITNKTNECEGVSNQRKEAPKDTNKRKEATQ